MRRRSGRPGTTPGSPRRNCRAPSRACDSRRRSSRNGARRTSTACAGTRRRLVVLLPLLLLLAIAAGRGSTTEPEMQAAARVLRRPISAWLLLTLIGVRSRVPGRTARHAPDGAAAGADPGAAAAAAEGLRGARALAVRRHRALPAVSPGLPAARPAIVLPALHPRRVGRHGRRGRRGCSTLPLAERHAPGVVPDVTASCACSPGSRSLALVVAMSPTSSATCRWRRCSPAPCSTAPTLASRCTRAPTSSPRS